MNYLSVYTDADIQMGAMRKGKDRVIRLPSVNHCAPFKFSMFMVEHVVPG